MEKSPHSLILINTPIGNLTDLTPRVRASIEQAQIIAAEDTRSFRKLMDLCDISLSGKKIVSFHDASSEQDCERLCDELKIQDVYYASEAGSPVLSDPAFTLVRHALSRGHEVKSVSGISAVTNALEVSGLPAQPFSFYGFLPRENNKKTKLFETMQSREGTHIFFEGVSRVERTCLELAEMFSENKIVVARELSKKFEQVLRVKGSDLPAEIKKMTMKGEFVICLHSKESIEKNSSKIKDLAKKVMDSGGKPKDVSKLVAEILGERTSNIYDKLRK